MIWATSVEKAAWFSCPRSKVRGKRGERVLLKANKREIIYSRGNEMR